MSRPRDPWALITRTLLGAGMVYMTWKLQTIERDVATLQQDVAYLSGRAMGGRRDR
jgi:hypothetical protein